MSNFKKADNGKTMMSLVEPEFIKGTARVLTMGAIKYEVDNWKNCEDRKRYEDALLRHIYDYLSGTKIDEESGESHLYHAACNLMFLDAFDKEGK